MEKSMEGSSDNEEEYHSASDSPSFHGGFGPSSALLACQFAVACVFLHQRARSQNGVLVTPGLPLYPLGLPRLPVKKKMDRPRPSHKDAIPEGTLQHSDGAPEERTARNGSLGLLQTKNEEGGLSAKSPEQTHSTSDMESPSFACASGMETMSALRASHARTHQQPWNASNIESSDPMVASSASTQEQPWSASSIETFPLPRRQEKPRITANMGNLSSVESFVPKTHTEERFLESPPLLRRRSKAVSTKDCSSDVFTSYDEEDGSRYYSMKMSTDKNLDRMSLKELQPKRRSVKRELDAVQNGEGSVCTLNLSRDGEVSLCNLDQRALDMDEDGLMGQGARRIMDMDLNTFRELPSEDYPRESSILSDNFSKISSSISPSLQRDKRRPGFSGYEANEYEDIQVGKQKEVDKNHEGFHTNIVFGDGSDLQDSTLNKSRNSESSPTYRMPEEGHLDSLLLWPVGVAVEAIAFQVRLIAQAFSLIAIVFNWCNSFASNRVRETLQVKERATEALSQKVAMITNVPPKVTESGSVFFKRAAWGCFAATYVCILLSMLLFPALLLDYVFLSKIVEEPVRVKEPLHFDYTLPHPTAIVFLHPSGGIHISTGKHASHPERARAIPIAHKVHITVILTLPESDYNRNLGMFQLSAELLSETGLSIKLSSRPCMLRFYSTPIRMLKTFLVSLPSLMGMFTESQTLVVHLMEFEEQQVATNVVRILLQPKAGMPLGQGIPEVYSADVHVESHLPWLKNFMRSWKWTVYIWLGLLLYVVEIIMVLCCCRQALLPKTWVGQSDEGKAERIGGNTPEEAHESGSVGKKPPEKQVRARHHSLNEHIPTARAILDQREHKFRQGGPQSRI